MRLSDVKHKTIFKISLIAYLFAGTWAEAQSVTRPKSASCQGISEIGCCQGNQLHFCKQGNLMTLDCATRPHCGWRERGQGTTSRGFYDCDTSGAFDPSGTYSRDCPSETVLPRISAKKSDPPCEFVNYEGCCAGDLLFYCVDGTFHQLDCALNRSCGWRPTGQIYNCGTEGSADPAGKHPKSCSPKLKPPKRAKSVSKGT